MAVTFLQPEDLQPITGQLNALAGADAAFHDQLAALEARVAALEVVPDPDPQPDPQPTELNLQLLGGLRLNLAYGRGGIAIDHTAKKLYVVGHSQRNEVAEIDLPEAYGTGSDVNAWPILNPTRIIPGWWQGGYANSLAFIDGKLWAAPKSGYDTNPPNSTTLYAMTGETLAIPLPRQRFSGFIKSATGVEFGCGGYESGQGYAYGPTLATLDGQVLMNRDNTNSWDKRERREPNYFRSTTPGNYTWVALDPVDIDGDGDLDGCWACDRIYGGGLRFSHGVYYWPHMGCGEINYNWQTPTFGATTKTYQYRYDPASYSRIGWKEFDGGRVVGHELMPDGKVCLSIGSAWTQGTETKPAIKFYEEI